MSQTLLLVDFENVHKVDISLLDQSYRAYSAVPEAEGMAAIEAATSAVRQEMKADTAAAMNTPPTTAGEDGELGKPRETSKRAG